MIFESVDEIENCVQSNKFPLQYFLLVLFDYALQGDCNFFESVGEIL